MRPVFHCLVEEWKDCEELKPQPKEKFIFVDKKLEVTKHQTEWSAKARKYRCVRCGSMKIKVKMYRTKILGEEFGKMGVSGIWEDMTW